MRFCYVKSLYFRYISKIKKFRTKNPGLGSFLYGIHCFEAPLSVRELIHRRTKGVVQPV